MTQRLERQMQQDRNAARLKYLSVTKADREIQSYISADNADILIAELSPLEGIRTELHTPFLNIAGETHVGEIRQRNEDRIGILEFNFADGNNEALVIDADGMGGYNAGDTAAIVTIRVIGKAYGLYRSAGLSREESLQKAKNAAGQALNNLEESNPQLYTGTDACVSMAVIGENGDFIIGTAGDTTALQLQQERLSMPIPLDNYAFLYNAYNLIQSPEIDRQLLLLQSESERNFLNPLPLMNEAQKQFIQANIPSQANIHLLEQTRTTNHKNIVLHSVRNAIDMHFATGNLPDGYLLVCSDGLWEMLSAEQIEAMVRDPFTEVRSYNKRITDAENKIDVKTDPTPEFIAKGLVTAARLEGGVDNISVIVVQPTDLLRFDRDFIDRFFSANGPGRGYSRDYLSRYFAEPRGIRRRKPSIAERYGRQVARAQRELNTFLRASALDATTSLHYEDRLQELMLPLLQAKIASGDMVRTTYRLMLTPHEIALLDFQQLATDNFDRVIFDRNTKVTPGYMARELLTTEMPIPAHIAEYIVNQYIEQQAGQPANETELRAVMQMAAYAPRNQFAKLITQANMLIPNDPLPLNLDLIIEYGEKNQIPTYLEQLGIYTVYPQIARDIPNLVNLDQSLLSVISDDEFRTFLSDTDVQYTIQYFTEYLQNMTLFCDGIEAHAATPFESREARSDWRLTPFTIPGLSLFEKIQNVTGDDRVRIIKEHAAANAPLQAKANTGNAFFRAGYEDRNVLKKNIFMSLEGYFEELANTAPERLQNKLRAIWQNYNNVYDQMASETTGDPLSYSSFPMKNRILLQQVMSNTLINIITLLADSILESSSKAINIPMETVHIF